VKINKCALQAGGIGIWKRLENLEKFGNVGCLRMYSMTMILEYCLPYHALKGKNNKLN